MTADPRALFRLVALAACALALGCAVASTGAGDEDGGAPLDPDGAVIVDAGFAGDGGLAGDAGIGRDAGLAGDGGETGVDGGFGDPGVRLDALPPGIGFDCIAPGCNQTRSVQLVAGGPGPVRIYAVQLELASSSDFRLGQNRNPPYDLARDAMEALSVVYAPTDARVDSGALLVDYGSPSSFVRGRIRIELQARVIGTARVAVMPETLSFGFVPMGLTGRQDVLVGNAGTGNALLELQQIKVLAGPNFSVTPVAPPAIVLGTGAEQRLTVAYTPTTSGVHTDKLVLKTTDALAETVEIALRGTSIEGSSAVLTPPGPVALGDVRVSDSKTETLTLSNQGGQPLTVTSLAFTGAGAQYFQVSPSPMELGAIAPFAEAQLVVRYAPLMPGAHDTTLTLVTNDPTAPMKTVALTARGINPRLVVAPTTVAFGRAVLGWVRGPTLVSARNDGFGPLKIERVYLAPGSSTELTLAMPPGLPLTLNQNNRVDFELRYSATTLATVTGRLVIESDDPMNARVEVPIGGEGVTCEQGCPLANATPRCETGQCAIGTCNSGYVNANSLVTDGCECRVEVPERSNLCADAEYVGSFVDGDGTNRTFTGQLHSKTDIDWLNAYGVDEGGISELFSDSYDVRITLSAPPGYKMCVFRVGRGQHENVCPSGVEGGCSGSTSYRHDGSYGSSDDSDYFIKVYNDGSGPTCGSFSVNIRNG